MRASTIMLAAVVLYVAHRWATGKTAIDGKTLIESLFVILVIAFLDQGKTEPIAKGFALLFLAVAAYTAIPSVTKTKPVKKVAAKVTPTRV
jgi:hypothetical protein